MSESSRRERLGQFPKDWAVASLPEVVYFQEGPGITRDKFRERGIPFLNIRCFAKGYINVESCQCVSERLAFGAYKHFLLDEGDLVFSSSGTIGKIARIRRQDLPLMLNTSTIRFRSRDESVAAIDYVKVFLGTEQFSKQHRHQSQGSAQVNLGPTHLQLMFLPLPPLPEQRKIASILTTVDRLIEQTEALIEKYRRVKQGMMADLLSRGVDEHGKLRPTQKQAPQLYKQSELGWIPKEWEVGRLDSVAEVNRGKFTARPRNDPKFYGGEFPFIQTGDVAGSVGVHLWSFSQTLNALGTTVSKEFGAGTILVTIAANIADTAILGVPMYLPDSVVGVVVNQTQSVRFIELCIRSKKQHLNALAPQTAQKNINLEDLRPLLIPIPDQREQIRVSERYESLTQQITQEQDSLTKLRTLKTGLMQDLLTGKVRVKVDQEEEAGA